jgi:hypothetical protein
LVSERWTTSSYAQGCNHAQSLIAYDPANGDHVLIALPCKQWSCRWCAENRIRLLAYRTRKAKPNRLLTLTVDPSLWADPRAAFDGTRRKIADLITFLRQRFGPVEYLRCTELTKAGWPHYHFLLRSNFIPHEVVKAKWQELTGAIIVDIRRVKTTFSAYHYLVKYLSKLHKIEWTERHVSFSRGFFVPEDETPPQGPELVEKAIVNSHPVEVLMSTYQGFWITRETQNMFRIHNTSFHEELYDNGNPHTRPTTEW